VTGYNRTPAPEPPWSQVIATTIRLWWQRHVREPTVPQAKRRRRYRRVGLIALIVALVAVSATAIQLARARSAADAPSSRHGHGDSAHGTAHGTAPMQGTPALAAAVANRQQAAAWVAAQVGHNVIVSCDPLMCAALTQHGFPAADLASLGPGAVDPLGSSIVVSTTAVRSELGTRLASVYAPTVIASFGIGESQVQVRVTAPDGAAAYLAAERADVHTRAVAGRQLLGNKNVRLPAAARSQLAAGMVDIRLLITLVALAHRYPVVIRSFGDAGPGAAPGAPLRSMDIAAAGGRYLGRLQAFLRAQRAPLLALTSVHGAGKSTVLTIEFTAPSPLGLLNQN
jgi:hypothetical protein